MFENDALCTTDKKRYYRTDTNGIEDNMSIITEETDILKTAIRVIKIEKFQRFCLKCGKILPTKIKQNYAHNCEKPDFLLWDVKSAKRWLNAPMFLQEQDGFVEIALDLFESC